MRRALLPAVLLLLALPASAQDQKAGTVTILDAWARPTAPQAPNGAVYLTMKNNGGLADRLLGAETARARKVELHTTKNENGVMQMRPLEQGVALPAGAEAAMKPGGDHVMLLGLTQPLAEGETLPLTLKFERAGNVNVDVAVRGGRPAAAPSHGH